MVYVALRWLTVFRVTKVDHFMVISSFTHQIPGSRTTSEYPQRALTGGWVAWQIDKRNNRSTPSKKRFHKKVVQNVMWLGGSESHYPSEVLAAMSSRARELADADGLVQGERIGEIPSSGVSFVDRGMTQPHLNRSNKGKRVPRLQITRESEIPSWIGTLNDELKTLTSFPQIQTSFAHKEALQIAGELMVATIA
ncbi:hypothetical protein BD410DRAFT_800324 [Rickenella mellea]|uniref:Uncharacterized protein n=1 Tax=Rickenella mellea TaxID=50990 RepID=A0A4Y7QFQ3_9AGAM|nr:hypothetical protein BD410DRAFT_800324 [Rickenella mellea]